jgi:hypothetical protein
VCVCLDLICTLHAYPRSPLLTLNCKPSQMEFVRHMMLVWRTYAKYMSSLTPQTFFVSPWTCLTTLDNTCPSPFVRCWCPGSDTIQITLSTSTTSHMAWIWKIISLHTSLPPQLALRPGVLTSMAVLYTTELLIQRIQGSHKHCLLPISQ